MIWVVDGCICLYIYLLKRVASVFIFLDRTLLKGTFVRYKNYIWHIFVIMVKYRINLLDIEMGNLEQVSNQQNWMIKGFIYVAQDIPKRLIHNPLILIFLLLFSSSAINSLIISLLISLLINFVIYSKKSFYSVFEKSKDRTK